MKKILFYTLFFSGISVQAQTPLKNVTEAIELARQHNPDLKATRQTAQWQAAGVEVARAGRMPTLKATSALEYNYALPVQLVPAEFLGGQPGEFRKLQFGVPFNLSAGLEANYALYNPTLKQDILLADLNRQTADIQLAAQQNSLETQVVKAYYLTALSQEAIELTLKNLVSTDSLLILTRQRLEAGTIEELDLNRTTHTRLTLADQLEQNRLAYANNLRQLQLLVGQEVTLDEAIAEKQLPVVAENLSGDVENYPQLRLKASQQAFYQASIDREKATRLPQLSLYGRYTAQAQRQTFNFLDFDQPWFSIGVVGIRLDVPIFNGGQRLKTIDRAKIRADIADTEFVAEKNRQLAQDAEWTASYAHAQKSLAVNKQSMTLAQRNLELAQLKYSAGLYTYDQYITLFNESLQIQNRYLKALADSLIYGGLLQTRP
ncbi:TolC family protein [Arundinibacter roseus]|uniref:TolC family protein n=1 Tax=Arundinibacter roseus TaxID=2070510 RepID=A0A4R4K926_9BACT|nr:TolC family protein [Arundinibacter roseus]TDB64198.1 TolC family protein [Arundinibacter roseus]